MTNEEIQMAINSLLDRLKENPESRAAFFLDILLSEQVRRATNNAVFYKPFEIEVNGATE